MEAKSAQNVVLAPTEQLRIMGAEVNLAGFLKGQVVSKGDTIPISIIGQRIDLVVISTNPGGPEMISKFYGGSGRGIRELFRKARQAAPCIIFFDIDALAPTRDGSPDSHVTERVISQMRIELDGLEILTNITVIAATNRSDIIDPMLLRPGRFDRLLYAPPPDKDSRLQILKIHTEKKPLAQDVGLEGIAGYMEGYTSTDIASVCSAAVTSALRVHIAEYKDPKGAECAKELKIGMQHFRGVMIKVWPLSLQELDMYRDIAEKFGAPRVSAA